MMAINESMLVFGRSVPWLSKKPDAFIPAMSEYESYLFACKQGITGFSENELSEELRSAICRIINHFGGDAPISPDRLCAKDIKKYIDIDSDRFYHFFNDPDDPWNEIASLYRLIDCYKLQEFEILKKYANKELSDLVAGIPTNIIPFFYCCRSDTFINTISMYSVSGLLTGLISHNYADGLRRDCWEQWEEVKEKGKWISKKVCDSIAAAASFLFIWKRLMHRFSGSNDSCVERCNELAKRAILLLRDCQFGNGSWPATNCDADGDIETTYIAIQALSLCFDDSLQSNIKRAGQWLENQWIVNADDYWGNPAIDLCCIDSLYLSQGDSQNISFNIVSGTRSIHKEALPLQIRFLHISDLHYNPKRDGGNTYSLRKDLLTTLREIVDSGNRVDELFITGDFRHAVLQPKLSDKSVITDPVDYIREIAEAVGINADDERIHIHIVPGNHDLSRKPLSRRIRPTKTDTQKPETKPISAYKYFRDQYIADNGIFSEEAEKLINSEFWFFRRICSNLYGSKKNPWKKGMIHTYSCDGRTVYLYMNTAMFHHSDADRGKLIIGTNSLEILLREIAGKYPRLPIVVLAHHSPDFFSVDEKCRIERLFENYPIVLYLCGDAHTPWWRMTNGHLELTAGCIKAGKNVQPTFMYGNTYNNEYKSYFWDAKQGWGSFSPFNESLERFLFKMGLKR